MARPSPLRYRASPSPSTLDKQTDIDMAGTGEFARSAPYGAPSAGHRPGVYVELDQAKMPEPPADWIGVKVYGPDGQLMGLSFVPPEHDDKLLLATAWGYFDARVTASEAAAHPPRLTLTQGGLK